MTYRLLVIVGVFALFILAGFIFRKRNPAWWSIFLVPGIFAYLIGKNIGNDHDLWGGGLMLFGMMGAGLGLLGVTHLGSVPRHEKKEKDV